MIYVTWSQLPTIGALIRRPNTVISVNRLSAHKLKKAEESLGIQIFERTNKKVLITEIGGQIVEIARRVLHEVDIMQEIADHAQDPLSGNFRLGAFPTLSTYLFPDLVPKIRSRLPRVRLILVEEKTDILIEQLNQGKLDAALLALPVNNDLLESKLLFDDEFLLAVNEDHSFSKKTKIQQSDLNDQQLLLLDEGHCLRGQALQVCQLNQAEEQQDVRATGLETLRQMVRAGTGITLMPEIAIQHQESGIQYIPFKNPAPKRTIGLFWRKTSARKQLMQKISELIIK